MYNILLCDDDEEILELLELYCLKEGFNIYRAADGLEALNILNKENIDLALIDIMMPKLNGLNVIKNSQESLSTSFIIISAKDEDYDKILGLELGADDYISKPFNPLEVMARIKVQLRKKQPRTKSHDILEIGQVSLNVSEATLKVNDCEKTITSIEFKILKYFMENPNKVLTKNQIYEEVWGSDFLGDDNTIMVYISKLRDKIEVDPKKPLYLKTIRGLGYKFEKRVD